MSNLMAIAITALSIALGGYGLYRVAGPWLAYYGYAIDKMMAPAAMPGANKLLLHGDRYRFEAVV